jgi:hypothetical protein
MSKILYINDLAKELGATTDAMRGHIQRKSDAIPPFFKRGRVYAGARTLSTLGLKRWIARAEKLQAFSPNVSQDPKQQYVYNAGALHAICDQYCRQPP